MSSSDRKISECYSTYSLPEDFSKMRRKCRGNNFKELKVHIFAGSHFLPQYYCPSSCETPLHPSVLPISRCCSLPSRGLSVSGISEGQKENFMIRIDTLISSENITEAEHIRL